MPSYSFGSRHQPTRLINALCYTTQLVNVLVYNRNRNGTTTQHNTTQTGWGEVVMCEWGDADFYMLFLFAMQTSQIHHTIVGQNLTLTPQGFHNCTVSCLYNFVFFYGGFLPSMSVIYSCSSWKTYASSYLTAFLITSYIVIVIIKLNFTVKNYIKQN